MRCNLSHLKRLMGWHSGPFLFKDQIMISSVICAILCALTLDRHDDDYDNIKKTIIDSLLLYETSIQKYSCTLNSYQVVNGKVTTNADLSISRLGESGLVTITSKIEKDMTDSLYCINDSYYFMLKRKRKDQAWAQAGLNPIKMLHNDDEVSRRFGNLTSVISSLSYLHLGGESLAFAMAKKNFIITKIEKSNDDSMITITFTFRHPVQEMPFNPIQGGKIRLNKNRHYLVQGGDYEVQYRDSKGVYDGLCTVVNDVDWEPPLPLPRVTKRKVLTHDSNGNVEQNLTYAFTSVALVTAGDKSQYYLTYYGLPEPYWLNGNMNAQIPWFMYLSIAGIFCLVLASFILYRKGRTVA